MLTVAAILGWSLGVGLTLTACVALLEWIARREDRQRVAQDQRRAALDRIVSRPSQGFREARRTNGTPTTRLP